MAGAMPDVVIKKPIGVPTQFQAKLQELRQLIGATDMSYLFPQSGEQGAEWKKSRFDRFLRMVLCVKSLLSDYCTPACSYYNPICNWLSTVEECIQSIPAGTHSDGKRETLCAVWLLRTLAHYHYHHFSGCLLVGPCLGELILAYRKLYHWGMRQNCFSDNVIEDLAETTCSIYGNEFVKNWR